VIPAAPKAAARAEAARLSAYFQGLGARPIDAAILQPADTLLDLYGEDIRARAYVTQDPLRGEMMLRPDFTVPVVQMHMEGGLNPARYTYAGEVFRRQESDALRPTEFLQVGYEDFDAADPAAADAGVFAAIAGALSHLPLRAVTGDIGVLRAAVLGLQASDARKGALLRHLWRPGRFKRLLARFGAPGVARTFAAPVAPEIGLRGMDEVAARIVGLCADEDSPPVPAGQIAVIDALLAIRSSAVAALPALRDLSRAMPGLVPAVDLYDRRLAALDRAGVAVGDLAFEGSYGRTGMEYYDGFVFGLYGDGQPDAAVATGGRYDALTAVLGGGRAVPAVGGVIRPERVVDLGAGA
jgi:ATP phosphoribosyltransferase regulatory subunit